MQDRKEVFGTNVNRYDKRAPRQRKWIAIATVQEMF